MIDAFAHRIDARVEGLQGVVDANAALGLQAGGLRQRGIRADADGHHHQVGGDGIAAFQTHRGDPPAFALHQGFGLGVDQELDTARFERALQQRAGSGVKLALHQPSGQMDHRHIHAAQRQAVGRFQSQQTAADHHRAFVGAGGIDHRLGVGDIAVRVNAGQPDARQRRQEGIGPGGKQQTIVRGLAAVIRHHRTARPIDARYPFADLKRDAVLAIPVPVVEYDRIEFLLAGQHRREQDAVVVWLRFGAKHGDVVKIGRDLQQLFHGANTGHSVAYDDQFHALHCDCLSGSLNKQVQAPCQ